MDISRRSFVKTTAFSAAALGASRLCAFGNPAVPGANDRIRVGVVGFSDRFKGSLLPSFVEHAKAQNVDIVALSDLWSRRRQEGQAQIEKLVGHPIEVCRNNEELYETVKDLDAVIISTADFQHALHTVEAVRAGKDVYTEKPLAETMADARECLKAVRESGRIVQIGSQRRSGATYQAAAEFIQKGEFGPIVNVDLIWNVNQPGRWRRPALVKDLKEEDVDWKRFLMNRPKDKFDPRKYLEYRLFWPYSSGIPGQWMCHQIDTVHWFSGLAHPRSVAVNGGIYLWKDGRTNADTLTAVFDYGPADDPTTGFQVIFSSRMTNSVGETKEIYYSNGGTLNLDKNEITPAGGLTEEYAKQMDMKPNLLTARKLEGAKAVASANTGSDPLTSAHMLNWLESVRARKQPNAPIEAGYNHAIAVIMTNAAFRTGEKVTFNEKKQDVIAGGRVFKY